ncbi:sensor histidine kinase [Streptomyces sp. NPDC050085]|uniref:sensor histidine kinase n=1 Tax=Streptomyces sp. NPDC050085 TaxID=3365600 RepID=UPI0037946A5D
MSFRLRALGLLLLVALAATAATAWLTWRQATGQVREEVSAGREEIALITGELYAYGYAHGTWDGVSATVAALSRQTGQRIRVVSDADVLLADSDALAGRDVRPVSTRPPVLVDPRPRLVLPVGKVPRASVKTTLVALGAYRDSVAYATCLTRARAAVHAEPDRFGMPQATADRPVGQCAPLKQPPVSQALSRQDRDAAMPCEKEREPAACLRRAFNERADAFAPARLQIRTGVLHESPPSLAATPTVLVAAGVALAVILGALLLSRAVLRPVRALTGAARALGEGDPTRRVPESGRDEIAGLGRVFNRMADSLQEAEDRQRRLTGDIAHELRTPLANLRGYLEALRDGVVEPTPELLDSLHREALLQQRIVDDLQDLALAEAGALTYHRAPVALRELLDTCRTAHRQQAEDAGVRVELAAARPVFVHGDPDRLRQVLGNLVVNALRVTAPGGVVTLALNAQGDRAVIEVRDTGTGIRPEDLPHLFDRFWRADAARGRATGGSGLGLAVAHRIVADHDGTIEVASTLGAGSTFTVVLPAASPPSVTSPRAPGSGRAALPVPPDTDRPASR